MSAHKRRQARLRSILNVPRALAQVAASACITTVSPAPTAPIPSAHCCTSPTSATANKSSCVSPTAVRTDADASSTYPTALHGSSASLRKA